MSALSDIIERVRSVIFRRRDERELAEELAFHADMEAAQLELRASPRGFKGADRNAELRVAFGQSNDGLSRVRHHCHDGKLKASVGIDRDPAAETENRIEHRASAFRQARSDRVWIFQSVAPAYEARAVGLKLGRFGQR